MVEKNIWTEKKSEKFGVEKWCIEKSRVSDYH